MALLVVNEGTRSRKWIALLSIFALGHSLVMAQTFTVLKSFSAVNPNNLTNSDGANPQAGVILFGDTLYGVTTSGGDGGSIYGSGTIYKMNRDGSGYTVLKNFPGTIAGVNNDGASPVADLMAEGETLYGVTFNGGTNGLGTIFRINTNGTGFQVLKQGTLGEAVGLFSKLVLGGGMLYGTATSGGDFTNGSVFRLDTNGTGFVTLKSFAVAFTNELGVYTNSDGANPEATLALAEDGALYGTTALGGMSGRGTIFRIKSDGSEFAVLKHFPALAPLSPRTNSDGASPISGLIIASNVLYGTTWLGGEGGRGTVFKINTNGGDYAVLKHFNFSDGSLPFAGLAINGHTLYGTTRSGGNATNGTVFKLNMDGSGFAVLKHFSTSLGSTNADGSKPEAVLFLDGSTLYGTTRYGGISANGVVFKLDLSPTLNFQKVTDELVLTWTNSDFGLQTSADLFGSFTNITGATSPFTNSIGGSQQFFRLISN